MNDQIRTRVKRLGKNPSFSTSGLCLICGRRFKDASCPHTVRDQEIALEAVYAEELLK